MSSSELIGLGDEAVRLAPGDPERPHAVGTADAGHAPGVLEEADQPLEGVAAVHRRGEEPAPVAAPAQDGPEAVQRPESPGGSEVAAVGPVELKFLAGVGLDRHADRGVPVMADPPGLPEVAHQCGVAALEALGLHQAQHRGPQQVGVRLQDLVDPPRPALVHNEQVGIGLPLGRWPAPLDPVADRCRVMAQRCGDLGDRPAPASQCHDVHVLLLRHHLGAPPVGRVWSPTGWGGNDCAGWISLRGGAPEATSTANFGDHLSRDSLIADTSGM